MIWLLLLALWSVALVWLLALCRAGHLEDVARGFVDDRPLPVAPRPRAEALPLAR